KYTEHARGIARGLDKAFRPPALRWWQPWRRRSAQQHVEVQVEADQLRIVVFSDLHRGKFDKADDFRRAHRAYRAALGWYFEQGYELWLLGDVEELWENKANDVVGTYAEVLELERCFVAPGGPGLRRFYGNHDLDWSRPKWVREHLAEWLDGTPVIESLRLHVREGGQPRGMFFLLHGHQGTRSSDTFAAVSRLPVRYVWPAIQRTQGWISTTPAESPELRGKHDRAMADWAMARACSEPRHFRPILIAGHTHHPIFPGEPPRRPKEEELAALRNQLAGEQNPAGRAELRGRIELMRAELWEPPYDPPSIVPPCYFNTGCASFPDGDVTCLELNGEQLVDAEDTTDGRGKIRLVRWLDNNGKPRPHQLASRSLRDVLEEVNAAVSSS
ncbi:MAG: hypothetical protein M3N47_09045, partial [Chloroflexota bacterium]|nr:hypothetical protein [Chloroflexota bacterium]